MAVGNGGGGDLKVTLADHLAGSLEVGVEAAELPGFDEVERQDA
jgi:hypothetical protein